MSGIEPTWYRGMYGCREDMFSRSALAETLAAERERIATAIETARDKWSEQITCEYDEGVADGHSDAARIARTPPQ